MLYVEDGTEVVTTIQDNCFFSEKYISNTTMLHVQNLQPTVDLMVKRLIFK